jgi:pyrroline-5-carboxylate reductase
MTSDRDRELATLGGGCFWCLEAVYKDLKGVESVVSGYAGGEVENPTYQEVCGGRTGHAEVVQITYDPQVITFRDLLDVFFTIHDPTTKDRQGADVGPQYRSIVLYHSPEQKTAAEQAIADLEEATSCYAAAGDLHGQGTISMIQGLAAVAEGRWADAETHYERSVSYLDAAGDEWAAGVSAQRLAELAERHDVTATRSNAEAVAGAGVVVIAVKPQDFDVLLGEIGGLLSPDQIVLSIAAAMPTAAIERRLAEPVPVLRAMPNTPATVHEGIAGICAGEHAGEEHLAAAEEVLSHLGRVVRVPEMYMDAVTAVSGSGPAYFALLAEAMIEAGILLGLSREISTDLVVQTMLGTAKLLRDEHMHPVELREMVTSPGGTTIRAIHELEQAGVRAAFLNAIQAAMVRSRELAAGEP